MRRPRSNGSRRMPTSFRESLQTIARMRVSVARLWQASCNVKTPKYLVLSLMKVMYRRPDLKQLYSHDNGLY